MNFQLINIELHSDEFKKLDFCSLTICRLFDTTGAFVGAGGGLLPAKNLE